MNVAIPTLLVAVLGCGGHAASHADAGDDARTSDATPLEPMEQSGSRLKIEWHDAAGTRVRNAIVDSARAERCAPTAWADGVTRCTPVGVGVQYSDAACTVPIGASFGAGCSTPSYITQGDAVSCTETPVHHLFVRGAEITPAAVYTTDFGGCTPAQTDGWIFYAVGEEVPGTDLVPLAGTEPGSGRLRPQYLDSPDGLRVTSGVRDTVLETRCTPFGDRTGVCAPPYAATLAYFSESTCTLGAVRYPSACTLPPYAVAYDGTSCPFDPGHYFHSGPPLATTTGFQLSGTTCSATDIGSDTLYRVGTAVELAATELTHIGAGRIQHGEWTSDGEPVYPAGLYDQDKAAACVVAVASDDVLRCLPTGPAVNHLFRDAGCSQAADVARVFRGAATCAVRAPPKFASITSASNDGCKDSLVIYAVGAEITTPLYQNVGTCRPVNNNAQFYEVGAIVPPTDFVPVTTAIDP